ncbi:MAG: pyridoxal-phosphate dependent enzyme [bacterium]
MGRSLEKSKSERSVMRPPDMQTIRTAHERIRPYIHRTPVFTSATLDRMSGGSLFFKCENLQKVGAFKARGASNAVFGLDEETASKGVVTHSSGNHAAALAYAAGIRGIPAYIVMPSSAPPVKKAAVEGYGGRITECEPTLTSREETAARIIEETGATLIHPFDDYRIIAGQATASLELLDQAGPLDLLLAPVGGGGLVSGAALTVHHLGLPTRVIACEPREADDAYRGFRSGEMVRNDSSDTLADGLRTSLSAKTFDIIRHHVHDIVLVSEEEIVSAMRTVWERMKIIIEPSSAVPVAAALYEKVPAEGARIGIILSGGNLDLTRLPFRS